MGMGDIQSTKSSGVFLLSPPDHFGYMEDTIFQVALATYLGQPFPMIAPLVRQYFRKRDQVLDKDGANLAAATASYTTNYNPFYRR